jgi:preprotein translocase subunit YajC
MSVLAHLIVMVLITLVIGYFLDCMEKKQIAKRKQKFLGSLLDE